MFTSLDFLDVYLSLPKTCLVFLQVPLLQVPEAKLCA